MCDRSDTYADAVSRQRIGGICSVLGWQAIQSSALQVMGDFLRMYIHQIGRSAKENAEICNRSDINLNDLEFTFKRMGINLDELEEYVHNFASSNLVTDPIVRFPAESAMRLNFLKPGSREVLHRKMHVYEYLPPMFPEMETADSPPGGAATDLAQQIDESYSDPEDSGFNHPENGPLREIASVMMTSAGFISPACEGKLPESRTPVDITKNAPLMRKLPALPSEPNNKNLGAIKKVAKKQLKDKKLSVFKKKKVKSEKALLHVTKNHADDVINSVIERGVIESEDLDNTTQLINKPNRNVKIPQEESLICLPPPPSTDLLPFESENPLIPKQLYGFGIDPVETPEADAPLLKSKGKNKEKSMKKKRAKKDKHDSNKDSKSIKKAKKEKKKLERLVKMEQLDQIPSTSGMKIKFKDISVLPPPPAPPLPRVLLKPKAGKKSLLPNPLLKLEPQLFQEPIKIERSSVSKTSQGSKRGRSTETKKKERPKKKRKIADDEQDPKYEGGGCITTQTVGHYINVEGDQVWICPSCSKQDDGSPMIGCDKCDDWYHWMCVGIQQEPDEAQNWFCQRCVAKQQTREVKATKKNRSKR